MCSAEKKEKKKEKRKKRRPYALTDRFWFIANFAIS